MMELTRIEKQLLKLVKTAVGKVDTWIENLEEQQELHWKRKEPLAAYNCKKSIETLRALKGEMGQIEKAAELEATGWEMYKEGDQKGYFERVDFTKEVE